MPLDGDRAWSPDQVLTGDEVRDAIDAVYPLEALPREPHATARVYRFADGRGEIGFINPVSEPFCADCNRIRMTAEGELRTCLFSIRETDLREPLRAGADRRRARADHPRRRLAQGAQAPRQRARLRAAAADDERDRRLDPSHCAGGPGRSYLCLMARIAVAVITGLALALLPTAASATPIKRDGGHWYELVSEAQTWSNAESYAEARHAHLATIQDSGENAFVRAWPAARSPGSARPTSQPKERSRG